MSTSLISNLKRSYPLSPSPHSASSLPSKMAFQPPNTPKSPSQLASAPAERLSSIDIPKQSASSAFPTPANSINGKAPAHSITARTTSTSEDLSMAVEDHSHKRKRDAQDSGDRNQKKLHVEDRRPGIEDLHLDVGKKYLLCRTPHPKLKPDLSQDLFELLSLNSIAAKVARVLPNGEKNGLRKTYKGKIKDLGISGKFDVSSREDDSPEGLLHMMRQPEEEWTIQNRLNNEIERGLSQIAVESLPRAMTMSKGIIPKNQWDSSVLGELDLPEKKVTTAPPPKPSAIGSINKTLNPSGQVRVGKGDIARPKRNVKKRGYEESSYEGYGEGYVDDDMVDAGYSTGEGESLSQKRRKKNAAPAHYPGPMRHNSYGPGMVGA